MRRVIILALLESSSGPKTFLLLSCLLPLPHHFFCFFPVQPLQLSFGVLFRVNRELALAHFIAVSYNLWSRVVATREKQVVDAVQVVTVLACCAPANIEFFLCGQLIFLSTFFVGVVINVDVLGGTNRSICWDISRFFLCDLLLGRQCVGFPLLLVTVDGIIAIVGEKLLWLRPVFVHLPDDVTTEHGRSHSTFDEEWNEQLNTDHEHRKDRRCDHGFHLDELRNLPLLEEMTREFDNVKIVPSDRSKISFLLA